MKEADRSVSAKYCPRCGGKVEPEMKFCPRCGTSLKIISTVTAPRIEKAPQPKQSEVLSLVSAGVFFMVLGLAYVLNPFDISLLTNYLQTMARLKVFIKPPQVLLDGAIFFFTALGIWGVILSGLRVLVEKKPKKAVSDLFGGLFSFYIAFLLLNYATNVFSAKEAFAFFIMGIGILIVANAILRFIIGEK